MVGNALRHRNLLYMSPFQKTATYLKLKKYSEENPEMNINAPKTLLSCSFEDLDAPISMNIDINGEVVTCTCFDSSFSLGNIFTSTIEEILSSPTIREIHERVLKRKEYLSSSVCKDCITYGRCQQGCIGRAINLGNELGLDGECDFRKALMIFNKTLGPMNNE